MNSTDSRFSIGTIVCIFIGALICVLHGALNGLFSAVSVRDAFRILSDGCFVSGVLLSGVGLLSRMGSAGAYDIFGYGWKVLWSHFTPAKPAESYYEYKTDREQLRKPYLKCAIHSGVAFLALSVIWFALYMLV